MQVQTSKPVNVAPSSTSGHFVENAQKVVNLDDINETFLVEGKSLLTTKNHTTLKMEDEKCLITTQKVYNPLTKLLEKSRD